MIQTHATSYGAEALTQLTATVAELKSGDPMTLVTVIVPNNLAGMTARRHLAKGVLPGTTGVAALEVSTLPRLAERLAAHKLAPRRPATTAIIATAWRAALADKPGLFEDVVEHPATLRALVDAHRELRDLNDETLDAVAASGKLAADVVRLHRDTTARIADGWYDTTDLLDAATDAVAREDFGAPVVIHLPQEVTQAEARFARALSEVISATVIAGLTGTLRSDESLHRTLQLLGTTTDASAEPPVAHRVLNASDADDEVRCVVREVIQTLSTDKAHRVAVLYSNANPYARLLHEHLAAAEISINGPGIRPVDERAVTRTFLELLALADRDVPRADLFRTLAAAPTHDFTGTRIPLARWERTSRSAGVVAGDDWTVRLGHYIESETRLAEQTQTEPDREWLAQKHRDTAHTAVALRDFAVTLRTTLDEAEGITEWPALSTWAVRLFTTVFGDADSMVRLPEEELRAAADLLAALRRLASLGETGGLASFRAMRDILELELSGALPRIGRFGDGVLVAPISAGIGLDLDTVFVVGLSEDLYPGRAREDAVLPERARDAANGELQTVRDQVNRKMRNLYAAFASASTVVASFSRGDLRRSSQRLPSRWLLPTLRELTGNHSLAATEWADATDQLTTSGSFAGELLRTANLATEQEWRIRLALSDQLTDDIVASGREMVSARAGDALTRFDGDLRGADNLPDYATGAPSISPTALESYATCPHAFFVQRLLKVQQLEQPEDTVTISAADIGTFMHACLDDLVQEFRDRLPGFGEPWSDEQRTRLLQIATAKADAYEQQGLTGHPTLWEGERRRIMADLAAMLDTDDAWRTDVDARVVDSELAFGMYGQAAVEVAVPSGTVSMLGSADKVDLGSDGTLYVTDVKTGSNRNFKGISQDDPVVGGAKLQLPVYAHAARARIQETVEQVATAYWFVRRDRGRIGIDLTPEVESLYAETLDVLVRAIAGGLFPPKAPDSPDFAWVQCDYCNPDGIGHAENRECWERKRHDPALRDLVSLIDVEAVAGEEDPP